MTLTFTDISLYILIDIITQPDNHYLMDSSTNPTVQISSPYKNKSSKSHEDRVGARKVWSSETSVDLLHSVIIQGVTTLIFTAIRRQQIVYKEPIIV
jgi:hypothetical protein